MKHAAATIWADREQREPKHDKGWTASSIFADQWPSLAEMWPEACTPCPHTPGKHAKPFGKHHPATPVTYDRAGNTTPLATVTPNLDVAA